MLFNQLAEFFFKNLSELGDFTNFFTIRTNETEGLRVKSTESAIIVTLVSFFINLRLAGN
jgi:hypothetical protein